MLFTEDSTENSKFYPDLPLFETTAYFNIYITNISVSDSWLPAEKKYLLFKISLDLKDTSFGDFTSISLRNCSNLAVMNSVNISLKIKFLSLMYCVFNSLTPLSFLSRAPVVLLNFLADQVTCSSLYEIKLMDVRGLDSLVLDSAMVTKSSTILFYIFKCKLFQIRNSAFTSVYNPISKTNALFNVSNCEDFNFVNSIFQSLRLLIIFSFFEVNMANLDNLTHSSVIFSIYLLWIGGSQSLGNMTISDLNFLVIQGQPRASFIPGNCEILEIYTYHTL